MAKTTKDFINESISKYGSKYTYGKTVYIKYNLPVTITCPIHGDFKVKPNHHLSFNVGCQICSGSRSNTKDFISKAVLVHGDAYDYSKTVYTDSCTNLIIKHKECGTVFEQRPTVHLRGGGCPVLAKNNTINGIRSTRESFIEKAYDVHGSRYTYDNVVYNNNKTHVLITCKKHGDYRTRPDNHLHGSGCPRCNLSKGEETISKLLDSLGIEYYREYRIPPYKYRYDFYVPSINMLIEYHGRQHYEVIEPWGGAKGLEERKVSDERKVNIARNSGYKLYAVSYLKHAKLNRYITKMLRTEARYWLRDSGDYTLPYKDFLEVYRAFDLRKNIKPRDLIKEVTRARKTVKRIL